MRLFSSSLLSVIKVVSSAYLRLLIFLPAIFNPTCASPNPAFHMMYSAYKLDKQGDNTALMYSFLSLEPVRCSMSCSNCYFLTCIQISQEVGKVIWYSHIFKNFHLDIYFIGASQVVLLVKNPPANSGDIRKEDSIPG